MELTSEICPQGLSVTTLKELETKDPSKRKLYNEWLFEGKRKQGERFLDIPFNIPFMFGIGGGLHVLYDFNNKKPEWKTIEWAGDPAFGYDIGTVYFRDESCVDYAKVAENDSGGWVWQKLVEEEKLSMKVGKKEWKWKMYFGPDYRRSVRMNNQLNEKGWAWASVPEEENFTIPDGLESQKLQSDLHSDHVVENYLMVDPERAELFRIKSSELDEKKAEELKSAGWEFIDSNIARIVYVRTK